MLQTPAIDKRCSQDCTVIERFLFSLSQGSTWICFWPGSLIQVLSQNRVFSLLSNQADHTLSVSTCQTCDSVPVTITEAAAWYDNRCHDATNQPQYSNIVRANSLPTITFPGEALLWIRAANMDSRSVTKQMAQVQ